MRKKEVIYLSLILLFLFIGAIRNKNRVYTFSKTRIVFDTFVEVQVLSKDKDFERFIDTLFIKMDKWDSLYSYQNPHSSLSQINQNLTDKIDSTLCFLLTYSKQIYYDSDSMFDVTVGALTDIWDFEKEIVPTKEQIAQAKKNIGFEKIVFDRGRLTKPKELKINLGAVAKGYIVDLGVEFLEQNGALSGFINAGGDIGLFGDHLQKIGIAHPREEGGIVKVVNLNNLSIVTSGDYERYFFADGRRYHHILNPKTGEPAEGLVSVSVIAKETYIADALATAVFVMGIKKGIKYINSHQDVEAICFFETADGIGHIQSDGFEEFIADE